MTTVVAFVVAAGIGAALRHLTRVGIARLEPIPLGTLVVNLTGSFLLGLLSGWDPPGATVVGTAGLGALTTFSTFAEEVLELRDEAPGWMAAYVGASVVGGVGLAWCGLRLA